MRRCFLLLLCLPWLGGCAGMYFDDAGEAPQPPPRYELGDLPFDEYWTGLVFNGDKIGFTHFRISAVAGSPQQYRLQSDASMQFHFLGIDKEVVLRSDDRVGPDLTVVEIYGDYDLDGNRLEVRATPAAGGLQVEVRTRDDVRRELIAVEGEIYPSSVIGLYPLYHGLEVGRSYSYHVYDGETRSVAPVTQEILAYERSELFEGDAFKIRTRLHGQEVTTWLSPEGLPLLEMSLGGVFISGLESETVARRYLALGALNKQESLLDFSRIPVEPPVERPRDVTHMTVVLDGIGDFRLPPASGQRCRRQANEAICEISALDPAAPVSGNGVPAGEAERYLQPTLAAPAGHETIRRLAAEITGEEQRPLHQAKGLVAWIRANVEPEAVDSFSALDVLANGRAECQGNTYLYTALARSLGIPTRVVNGLVYSESPSEGFLYHTWAESFLDGRWIPVDPTFAQVGADATHLVLVEGESLAEIAPMVGLIGRVKARVADVEHR